MALSNAGGHLYELIRFVSCLDNMPDGIGGWRFFFYEFISFAAALAAKPLGV